MSTAGRILAAVPTRGVVGLSWGEPGTVYFEESTAALSCSVDLIADVTGYFDRSAAGRYTSLNPVRFVDTRVGLGAARGQVAGQGTFAVQITGRSGIPSGATALALNVTVTNPKQAGHLTVFPRGQAARPPPA